MVAGPGCELRGMAIHGRGAAGFTAQRRCADFGLSLKQQGPGACVCAPALRAPVVRGDLDSPTTAPGWRAGIKGGPGGNAGQYPGFSARRGARDCDYTPVW